MTFFSRLKDQINRTYNKFYYKTFIFLWDKFSNTKHWETLQLFFSILFLKRIWYDQINEYDHQKNVKIFNPTIIKRDFKLINSRAITKRRMLFLTRETFPIEYKISFIVQYKTINTSALDLSKTDKVSIFVKINNQNFSTDQIIMLRDYLTVAAFAYLCNNDITSTTSKITGIKERREPEDRLYIHINNRKEIQKMEKVFDQFFDKRKYKKLKDYVKRKFGAEQTVQNMQHIWSRSLSYEELLVLIDKFFRIKHDFSTQEIRSIKDIY